MTPRAVREQLLAGFLVCLGVLIATFPAYGQKNENNPDKIGHRTVARKSIISPEKEGGIGKAYAEQFEKSAELVQDSVVQQYVTSVAGNVVSHSDWKGPVAVKVLKSPQVNSASFPGGFIYLSSGLLLAAENDDEIAAVIAHQVAHAAARHWASDVTKATIMQFAMIPLLFIPPNTSALSQFLPAAPGIVVCGGYIDHGGLNMAVPYLNLKYLRQNEMEADYLGLQYVYKAGYDPSAYVAFLSRLPPENAISQSNHDSSRATPPVSERIAQAEKEIRKILPNAPQPRSSPELDLMKSHL